MAIAPGDKILDKKIVRSRTGGHHHLSVYVEKPDGRKAWEAACHLFDVADARSPQQPTVDCTACEHAIKKYKLDINVSSKTGSEIDTAITELGNRGAALLRGLFSGNHDSSAPDGLLTGIADALAPHRAEVIEKNDRRMIVRLPNVAAHFVVVGPEDDLIQRWRDEQDEMATLTHEAQKNGRPLPMYYMVLLITDPAADSVTMSRIEGNLFVCRKVIFHMHKHTVSTLVAELPFLSMVATPVSPRRVLRVNNPHLWLRQDVREQVVADDVPFNAGMVAILGYTLYGATSLLQAAALGGDGIVRDAETGCKAAFFSASSSAWDRSAITATPDKRLARRIYGRFQSLPGHPDYPSYAHKRAMALALFIEASIAQGVTTLCLDNPFHGLDDFSRHALVEVLAQATLSGLQVIVNTANAELYRTMLYRFRRLNDTGGLGFCALRFFHDDDAVSRIMVDAEP